jgi:DNA-binding PadR family transcriptional regulator
VNGADAPTGGRKRTVYTITGDGEEELKTWLRQPPEAFEMRDEGLLKLFFAEALPPTEAVEIVRTMRRSREAVNTRLRELEPEKDEDKARYPLVVLRCGIEFTDWFVDWCRRVEEQILAAAGSEKRRS